MAKNRTHLQCNSVVDNHGLVNDYRTMSEIRQVKGMSRNNEHTSRQTHLQCDSVVDDHGLAKDVGAVLGVGQLGVEIQPEVFIIVHLLVSKHNNLTAFFA